MPAARGWSWLELCSWRWEGSTYFGEQCRPYHEIVAGVMSSADQEASLRSARVRRVARLCNVGA